METRELGLGSDLGLLPVVDFRIALGQNLTAFRVNLRSPCVCFTHLKMAAIGAELLKILKGHNMQCT